MAEEQQERQYVCNDRYQPKPYRPSADRSTAGTGVLYVKQLDGSTIEIPSGTCEVGLWYKHRVEEATGIDAARQRLMYAGAQLKDDHRHSGLQRQTTLHLVVRRAGGAPPPDKGHPG